MTGGEVQANPAEMRVAAGMLDNAAIGVRVAGEQITTGRTAECAGTGPTAPSPFGASAQARSLTAQWNTAVAARVEETRTLDGATQKLAERLRAAADAYGGAESGNVSVMNSVRHDLSRGPH
jgi:hypothetical protein